MEANCSLPADTIGDNNSLTCRITLGDSDGLLQSGTQFIGAIMQPRREKGFDYRYSEGRSQPLQIGGKHPATEQVNGILWRHDSLLPAFF